MSNYFLGDKLKVLKQKHHFYNKFEL